jgi:hypothetical protein
MGPKGTIYNKYLLNTQNGDLKGLEASDCWLSVFDFLYYTYYKNKIINIK